MIHYINILILWFCECYQQIFFNLIYKYEMHNMNTKSNVA